jgi:PilZ domain
MGHTALRQKTQASAGQGNSGKPSQGARRHNTRYKVADTFVLCARRRFFGFWRPIGQPFPVVDIGFGGMSFMANTQSAKVGARLRLSIHLPGMLTFVAKGIVRQVHEKKPGLAHVGIRFADIDTQTYAALKTLCARRGKLGHRTGKGLSSDQHAEAYLASQGAMA